MAFREDSLIGRATRGGRVLVAGNGLAQLIGFLASLVLTRLYTTDEIGYLTIFMSLLGVLGLVANLRYDQAVLAADDEETAERVLALSLLISAGFGAAAAVVLLAVRALGGERLGASREFLATLNVLLPLGLAGMGAFQALVAYATRRQVFRAVAAGRVLQGAAAAAVQIVAGWLVGGWRLLLAGLLVGQAAGIARLLRAAPAGLRDRAGRAGLAEVARRYDRFPRYASFAALLNSGALLLPTILLGALYGSTVAGWYGLGQRVIGLPMFVIGGAAAQVYASRFSTARRDGRPAARALMSSTLKRLLPVSAAILAGSLVAGRIFEFMYGPEWRTAGDYVAILAIPFALQILTSPVSITANLMDRQDLQLLFDGGRLALVVGALAASRGGGLDARGAVIALAAVLTVTYLGYLVMYWSLLKGDDGDG